MFTIDIPNHATRHVKNQETVFRQPDFADWKLVCKGKMIPCHRFILASKSPVFKRIFEASAFPNWTELDNVKLKTLQNLLEFMYTGSFNRKNCDVAKLFELADEYEVSALKSTCEVLLSKDLRCENVVELLQLATLHKGKNLKENCLHFIAKYFKAVQSTKSWNDLKNEFNSKNILEEIIEYMSCFMIKD